MVAFTSDPSEILQAAAVTTVALLSLILALPVSASASSELEMSGFTVVQETGSGRWEIQARKASYIDEREVLLNGVSARMTSEGEDRISVVSERGRYEPDQLVLHLEGNVVVASRWGSSLQAPAVLWNGSGAYLEASGGVKLQRGSIMVYGASARYSIDTGTAWVLGKVRAVVEMGKNGP